MRISALFLLGIAMSTGIAFGDDRGLADAAGGSNKALIVSVGHGLSGLDLDVNNVKSMVSHPAYDFRVTEMAEDKARVADVKKGLTQTAQDSRDGTMMFYYTGHGGVGTLWLQDTSIKVEELRAAIEEGRKNMGPLKRLVLIYDSCHAGSMMDGMRKLFGFGLVRDEAAQNALVADTLVNEFTQSNRDGAKYWNKLMVIASSRADENSLASAQGSIFTLAMKKAFDESIAVNHTVGKFIELSQTYTVGHHPVARLVPAELASEKMVP